MAASAGCVHAQGRPGSAFWLGVGPACGHATTTASITTSSSHEVGRLQRPREQPGRGWGGRRRPSPAKAERRCKVAERVLNTPEYLICCTRTLLYLALRTEMSRRRSRQLPTEMGAGGGRILPLGTFNKEGSTIPCSWSYLNVSLVTSYFLGPQFCLRFAPAFIEIATQNPEHESLGSWGEFVPSLRKPPSEE